MDVAKQALHQYLRDARAAVVSKLDGIDEYDRRRPLTGYRASYAGPYKVDAPVHAAPLRARTTNSTSASPATVSGATQHYLGAGAHMVTLREGDLAFFHTHAEGKDIAMELKFPTMSHLRQLPPSSLPAEQSAPRRPSLRGGNQ